MSTPAKNLDTLLDIVNNSKVSNWNDISSAVAKIEAASPATEPCERSEIDAKLNRGIAFITYDFGIDGVSIEIAKYADCLADIYSNLPLHFIGGDFYDKADIVLRPEWRRFKIDGINGWSKWYDGEWFSKLYYEEMPEGSEKSDSIAQEMWKQASDFTIKLSRYLVENDISLLIPVNIPTNPGNFAIQLAIIMTTEALGAYVISSNHDFYWEGGKSKYDKEPGEDPGVRDHFFKNIDNKPFFSLFKSMYPWNGRRWLQVNINTPQSEALVERFGFDKTKVFELGTSISDKFFEKYSDHDVKLVRRRMAYILSDGNPIIRPVALDEHLASLDDWMANQHPIACAVRSGLTLDPTTDKTIYCLQPTRVIGRKRIEKDVQLMRALFAHSPFKDEFVNDKDRQLVFHITGPVPIEHKADLESVLNAFKSLCESVDADVADRLFITFSVGTEDHPSLEENGLSPLCIEEIYRLATVILFPSETEGRGLPIIESSACGVPIICSRYYPEEVFAEVVGEGLPDEEQIKYLLFPEDTFSSDFLDKATKLMLHTTSLKDLIEHNKEAVHSRYGTVMIRKKFQTFIETLRKL